MKHLTTLAVATIMTLSSSLRGAEEANPTAGANRFRGELGLQLYSLRDQFAKDVPGTLRQVHELGFHTVELAGTYGKSPTEFKTMLAAHHLKAVAGHFSYERLRDDPEGVATEAKALGLEYAGTAWIPHQAPFNETIAREAIKVFNRAGEVLAGHGIKFYYHNHGYEFHPHGDGTLFDLIVRETKPEWVSFQMDVMWVVFPGQDPVKLMEKYGNRWSSMHLKDLKKGVATGSLAGGTDTRNGVVLGTGQTDWPALLRAAQKAGVKYYFIEDESPDVLQQIPQSIKYVGRLKF